MKLNERLGVPEGINQQAEELYKKIISSLGKIDSTAIPQLDEDNTEFQIELTKTDLKIADLDLQDVPVTLDIIYHEEVQKPTLISAAHSTPISEYIKKRSKLHTKAKVEESSLNITLAVPEKWSKQDAIDEIKKLMDTSTVAHEIKHFYDCYKNPTRDLESTADYISFQKLSFPESISNFLHLLYYTTSIENVVRPTEIYQQMIDEGITKSEFKEFIKHNKIIKKLTDAQQFSLEKFIQVLNRDPEVENFLKFAVDNGYKRIGDNAEDAMNIITINLINLKFETLRSLLTSYVDSFSNPAIDFIAMITGRKTTEVAKAEEEASQEFNKIVQKHRKYGDDYKKFLEYLQKKLNFTGNKMKRKLYKLYDMLPDKKSNESVINWDLHTKKADKKLTWVVDFSSFKNKKK